jgi:hypothetical protein
VAHSGAVLGLDTNINNNNEENPGLLDRSILDVQDNPNQPPQEKKPSDSSDPNQAKPETPEELVIKNDYGNHHFFAFGQKTTFLLPNYFSAIIAGIFAAIDSSYVLDPDEQPEIGNEIREIGEGLGFIFGTIFYGWYYYKRRISPLRRINKNDPAACKAALIAEANELKQTAISWIDRYESGSMLGKNIGETVGAALPLPAVVADFLKTVIGYFVGCIIGAVFAFCMDDKKKGDADIGGVDKNSIYNWGKDGWTTYSKTGMMVGALIGALVLGIIGLFSPIPGGMVLGIALGTAAGSVAGYFSLAGGVPLVNILIDKFAKKDKKKDNADNQNKDNQNDNTVINEQNKDNQNGNTVIDNQNKENQKNNQKKQPASYRTNYIRAGITLGAAIGGIFGFGLSFLPPFCFLPLASLVTSTIFSNLFGLMGAAIFGILGPYISNYLDPDNELDDNWDYGLRSGMGYGKEAGNITTLGYKMAGGDSNYELKNVASGGFALVAGAAAMVHDVFFPNRKDKPLVSWSKRIWLFGSIGGSLGSAIGVVGGPVGMMIGFSVGYLVFGAIGVIWGEEILKKIYSLENEFLNGLLNKLGVPGPIPEPIPEPSHDLKPEDYDKHMKEHDHKYEKSESKSKEDLSQPVSLSSSMSSTSSLLSQPSYIPSCGLPAEFCADSAGKLDVTDKFNPQIPITQNLNIQWQRPVASQQQVPSEIDPNYNIC